MRSSNKTILSGIFLMLILCRFPAIMAQWELSGYLSNMGDVMFEDVKSLWVHDNLIHNRLQLKGYLGDHLTADIEIRNRFFYGTSLNIPGYDALFSKDHGWLDLSLNVSKGPSYIINSMVDRAWVNLRFNKLEIRAGRQRINWGQTYVWNPNDIFNAYSFFDVDYPEKPGSDAVRIQYFAGTSSKIELTAKVDEQDRLTAGTRINISPGMYDFQYFAGILNGEDWVTGIGWSGNLGNAGFKGETTLFMPRDSAFSKSDIMVSLGADYAFRNNLYLQFEFLYSSVDYNLTRFSDFYFQPLSVKTISFTDVNVFAQMSYPITPLLNGSISMIYYPSLKGVFLGPTLSVSITDNTDFSFMLQHFNGEFDAGAGKQKLTVGFLRLKWSF